MIGLLQKLHIWTGLNLRNGGDEMHDFETFLVEQCAPVLAGIKPGSMFPYKPVEGERLPELLRRWNETLAPKGVQVTSIKRCRRIGGYLIYVYRPRQIAEILAVPAVAAFLADCGYEPGMTLPQTLRVLTRRLCQNPDFPHEVGVFLGYPLRDILGFIENQGRDSLCTGCWKVYHEPQKALRTFQDYRACTAAYRSLYRGGSSVAELTCGT